MLSNQEVAHQGLGQQPPNMKGKKAGIFLSPPYLIWPRLLGDFTDGCEASSAAEEDQEEEEEMVYLKGHTHDHTLEINPHSVFWGGRGCDFFHPDTRLCFNAFELSYR